MKLILASIIGLSLVVLFVFALFPADIGVSRIIQTGMPRDSLYNRVADLRNWAGWNRLLPASGRSAESSADRLSYPELTIDVLRRSPDSVVTRWTGSHGKSFTGSFRFGQEGTNIILQWSMQFHLNWYPWEKLSGMFYERRFGEAMDSSLLNLTKTLSTP